jgi:hypothetical protein
MTTVHVMKDQCDVAAWWRSEAAFAFRILPSQLRSPKFPYSFRIAYLPVGLAVIGIAWRRWTEHVLKSNDERLQKRLRVKWLLRPSNLLMLVSVSSFMYWGLHKECAASGYLFALSWIGIGAAFVVRRREDQSLNQ